MNEGWIKLHRSLLDWEWFGDSNTFHVFVYLILKSCNRDHVWRGTPIPRGSLITSIRKIADETGVTEKSVRTAIQRLREGKQIIVKPTNKHSLITICKYSIYQAKESEVERPEIEPMGEQKGEQTAHEIDTQGAHESTHEGTRSEGGQGAHEGHTKGEPTNKNVKNVKNVKKDYRERGEYKGGESPGESVREEPVAEQPPTPKKVERDLSKIEEEFRASLNQFAGDYSTEMLDDFADYWLERSPGAKKFRFEKEGSWDLNRRLKTWAKMERKFSAGRGGWKNSQNEPVNTLNALVGAI